MNFLNKTSYLFSFINTFIYSVDIHTDVSCTLILEIWKEKKITNLNNVEFFFRVGGVLECELTLSLDSGGRNGKLLLMYQRFYK